MTTIETTTLVTDPTTSDDDLVHITCHDTSDGTRLSLCGIDLTHEQPAETDANCVVCEDLESNAARFCPKKAVCDCVNH